MNLLVKRLGLVLLPALFFACEEPTELGANLNPNIGAVSTHYIEIPVSTSQLSSDSLVTSLRNVTRPDGAIARLNTPFFIGKVENEDFGTIKSSLYSNLAKPSPADLTGNIIKFDSVKFQIVWDNTNVYGDKIATPQQYTVYQLAAPISSTGRRTDTSGDQEVEVLAYNYKAANKEALGMQLGQLTLDLEPAIANKLDTAALADASSRTLSTHLPQEFVEQLYQRFTNDAKPENLDKGIFSSQEAFDAFIKGIAVVPGENNSFLTSVNVTNEASGLMIYYQQGVTQKVLRVPLVPAAIREYDSYPVYFGLETDRSGTGLSNAPSSGHMIAFDPADERVYFQALTGIYPRVDYNSAFKEFLAALGAEERIAINRAVLEFDSVLAGSGKRQQLPSALELYFVGSDNRRFISPVLRGPSRALSTSGFVYKSGDVNVNAIQSDIVYSLEEFMRSRDERLLQAILYPADGLSLRPENFVIRPDQVRLKIWYTKLNGTNL